jgi:hypothetical protein
LQRAVEYYSGINDEKYIYFTERIQNLLCRPDILQMMNSRNSNIPVQLGVPISKQAEEAKGDLSQDEVRRLKHE